MAGIFLNSYWIFIPRFCYRNWRFPMYLSGCPFGLFSLRCHSPGDLPPRCALLSLTHARCSFGALGRCRQCAIFRRCIGWCYGDCANQSNVAFCCLADCRHSKHRYHTTSFVESIRCALAVVQAPVEHHPHLTVGFGTHGLWSHSRSASAIARLEYPGIWNLSWRFQRRFTRAACP